MEQSRLSMSDYTVSLCWSAFTSLEHQNSITAHKPLLPLFNKAAMRLPRRIENWVMGMQDVDFELIYEPVKDDADPLDFLSRRPLPEKGKDAVERVIKYVVTAEPAVIVDQIKEETCKNTQLQKLSARILTRE